MENNYFEVKKLDNDLPVLMVNYPDGQTVTVGITYNVGGRNEWQDKSLDGISHFLEHQFFKGNENLSPLEVNERLDALGGITNAFTTEDTTCYFTKSLNTEIDDAIDLWSEILNYGDIDPKEFEKESFVVRQEFRRLEDNPVGLLYKKMKSTLFKGTSLEMDVIGTEESLENVTIQQMEEYREKHYGLENAAIMVLGNYDKNKVYRKLNSVFGSKEVREEPPSYQLSSYKTASQSKMKTIHIDKKTPLAFFGLAVKTPGGKSDYQYPLELLMNFLTLGKSSILKKRLVRTGICSFATSFTQKHEDVGDLIFIAGTPPQMYEKAHEESFKMLHDTLKMEITSDMLDDICDRIEYDLRSAYEEPMSMLFQQATGYWRTGSFESMEETLEKLRSVSVNEFNKVRDMVLGNINGVYGTLGSITPLNYFPDGTWEGEFIDAEIPETTKIE